MLVLWVFSTGQCLTRTGLPASVRLPKAYLVSQPGASPPSSHPREVLGQCLGQVTVARESLRKCGLSGPRLCRKWEGLSKGIAVGWAGTEKCLMPQCDFIHSLIF